MPPPREEIIVPYSRAPEEVIPGKPMFFATTLPFMGTAFGVLVESHEGRPTRIEGNPRHPESLGAASTFIQASVLDLYDPDRSANPTEHGSSRTWDDAVTFLRRTGEDLRARKGKGLAILTEAHRSPSLAALLGDLSTAMPRSQDRPLRPPSAEPPRTKARESLSAAPLEPVYDLEKARVIVALDADLFATEGSPVKHARGFSATRSADRVDERGDEPALRRGERVLADGAPRRTIVSGSPPRRSRRSWPPSRTTSSRSTASRSGPRSRRSPLHKASTSAHSVTRAPSRATSQHIAALASSSPASLSLRPFTALASLLNQGLGNVGTTVRFVAPFDASSDGPEGLRDLAAALRKNQVETPPRARR